MKENKEFKKKVRKKYDEMKKAGIYEDYLNKEIYGGLKVFINQEPIFGANPSPEPIIEIDSDKVYVGTNVIK